MGKKNVQVLDNDNVEVDLLPPDGGSCNLGKQLSVIICVYVGMKEMTCTE